MSKKHGKQGEGGGRPSSFKNLGELQEKIVAYLEECKKEKLMPNRAGLSVYLEISRDTYYEYRKKNHKYSDSIKRFEEASESIWVQRLGGNSPTGAIFYLKNAFKEDYRDKHENDITSNGQTIVGFNFVRNETDNKTD